jgi:hypothetical protein
MRDAGLLSKKMAGIEVFSTSNRNSAPLCLPELSPEVQERGEITLFRKFPSVFFGTNFATQLHALNVDTLVICGACTSGSVRPRGAQIEPMRFILRIFLICMPSMVMLFVQRRQWKS